MAKETQSKQEFDPEGQVDPRWANQFNRMVDLAVEQRLASLGLKPGLVIEPVTRDREPLTTPEEAKVYDEMLERDFLKIDPEKKKVIDRKTLYKPIHIFPQYQSSNPTEFIAIIVVEVYRWEKNVDETKRRQIVTCFNIKAKDFRQQYKATMIEAIPEVGEE